jgi:hypothetical protein
LRKPFVDENGIQAFHVGKADELVDGSVDKRYLLL